MMDNVYKAYSSRNDHALSESLRELQRQLSSKVQILGPAAVALELRQEQPLIQILSRIEADAEDKPRESMAFFAGFIRAYVDYLKLIADHQDLNSADAQLSANRDEHDQADTIRMMILKAAFAHAGARAKELVGVVARTAKVSESSVKFHLRRLENTGLVERLKLSRKAVSYRITPRGEAVLARRSKPYELALFFIDEAASDEELRAAIIKEIEITWPGEQNEERLTAEVISIFSDTPTVVVSSGPWSDLNNLHREYLEERGPIPEAA